MTAGVSVEQIPVRRTPVPRWAVVAAHLAAWCPVPSSLWRLPLIFGIPLGMPDDFMDDLMSHPFWLRAGYLILLGAVSDGAAYLTLGLVREWGRVFPAWLPLVGGRRVPRAAALTPAVVGGVSVTCLFTWGLPATWPDNIVEWNAGMVLMTACYLPLTLWGPLLLAVAWDYHRRTR